MQNQKPKNSIGFSLLEMAVVIALMSVMLTMGLGLMNAKLESAAWSETKLKQEKIKVALVGFIRQNGRLPCPNNVAPWDGAEDSPCLGNLGRGVVPWQALGLARADAQDGWGNFISYRVANSTPATVTNWTINTGGTAFSISDLNTPLVALTVQERNTGGAIAPLTNNAVVTLVSHGKNGFGARTIGGTQIPAPPGADEQSNATTASTTFVIRQPNDVPASIGGLYDDLVTYMTPLNLLQPLVDDKTLKAANREFYRTQALLMAGMTATPTSVPPCRLARTVAEVTALNNNLNTIMVPRIGNSTITYACLAGQACNTATQIRPGTPDAPNLFQISVFGTVENITYTQLTQAFPAIATRCP